MTRTVGPVTPDGGTGPNSSRLGGLRPQRRLPLDVTLVELGVELRQRLRLAGSAWTAAGATPAHSRIRAVASVLLVGDETGDVGAVVQRRAR